MNASPRLLLTCLLSAAGLVSAANFKIPSGVYDARGVAEAMAEAKGKGEPISFVYADPQSTCGIHNHDTEEALSYLKRFSVVVLLSTEDKATNNNTPPPVMTALQLKEMGNIIPKVATTSPDGLTVYGTLSHKQMGGRSGYNSYRREVDRKLSRLKGDSGQGPLLYWPVKDKTGSNWIGSFEALKGDKLLLKNEQGKVFQVPLDKLGPAAAEYARHLAGQGKEAESAPAAIMETWTSRDGRTLEASFKALNGNQVTLVKESGEELTFSIDWLSDASVRRAQTLAKLP